VDVELTMGVLGTGYEADSVGSADGAAVLDPLASSKG
jgi:hypothetical protein